MGDVPRLSGPIVIILNTNHTTSKIVSNTGLFSKDHMKIVVNGKF